MKKTIITGIPGQDGSYLIELLLKKGYHIYEALKDEAHLLTLRVDHFYKSYIKNLN